MMDFSQVVDMVWPWVAGGGLGWLLKSSRRIRKAEAESAEAHADNEEWQVYKDQLAHLSGIVKTQNDLISEMTVRHAQERRECEERFANQTDRLREVQRALVTANERELGLSQELGRVRVLLEHFKNWHCRRDFTDCDRREPEQMVKTRYLPVAASRTGDDGITGGGGGDGSISG